MMGDGKEGAHNMTLHAPSRVIGAEDNIDKDALNKELDERLDDRFDHVEQFLVRPVVLPPITLDNMRWLCNKI